MIALKLTQVGDTLALVLPEEAQARLRVEQGDTVFLTELPDGYSLTTRGPDGTEAEEQAAEARRIMLRRRAALRELAR